MNSTTDGLVEILSTASEEEIGEVLDANREKMFTVQRPFAAYIRELFAKYNLIQNQVIEKAGFTLPYGYRLLSEERHTKQRDYILRFCLVCGFSLDETQRLLKLYGMSPLYARIPRDAVLIAAVSCRETDIERVNIMLRTNGFAPLLPSVECGTTAKEPVIPY